MQLTDADAGRSGRNGKRKASAGRGDLCVSLRLRPRPLEIRSGRLQISKSLEDLKSCWRLSRLSMRKAGTRCHPLCSLRPGNCFRLFLIMFRLRCSAMTWLTTTRRCGWDCASFFGLNGSAVSARSGAGPEHLAFRQPSSPCRLRVQRSMDRESERERDSDTDRCGAALPVLLLE